MMHRSTTFHRFQSFDWAKVIMHSNQHILCYVGMGWFSRMSSSKKLAFLVSYRPLIRANMQEYYKCVIQRLFSTLLV